MGVHTEPQISRDLAWMREHWKDQYGLDGLDPAIEIGEAITLFKEAEIQALRDFDKMAEPPPKKGLPRPPMTRRTAERIKARQVCLKTAIEARQARLDLLQDIGKLDRVIGEVDLSVRVRADDIRRVLQSEGMLEAHHQRLLPADTVQTESGGSIPSWLQDESLK